MVGRASPGRISWLAGAVALHVVVDLLAFVVSPPAAYVVVLAMLTFAAAESMRAARTASATA